jgi:hypothetical protein
MLWVKDADFHAADVELNHFLLFSYSSQVRWFYLVVARSDHKLKTKSYTQL